MKEPSNDERLIFLNRYFGMESIQSKEKQKFLSEYMRVVLNYVVRKIGEVQMYNKGFENRGRGNGRGYDNPEPVVFEFSSLGFVDSKGNLREELMTVEAEK